MPKQPEVVYSKPIKDEKFEKFERSLEVYEEEAKSLETIEEEAFSYETNNKNNIRIKEPDQPFVVYSESKTEENVPVFNLKDMDLRQGIIYAEILNRKYF
ncbi:MAG: hypothetical protein HC905_05485 [Bacteroidales bacterium]|nr:hypothetical protein [Bacteroidales bacterium]